MELTHKGTIQLETKRLILRRFTAADDSAMFHNWANDPEVTKYLTWQTHTAIEVSRDVLNDWIPNYEKPDYYHWGIELKETGTLIGSTASVKQDDKAKMVHIGYCIGKTWWRKGYTSEALIRLVQFFFEEVGVNRIESRHDPRNPGSGKVMQNAGLRYEGTSIESDWNNQGICDAANYAILAREYFKNPLPTKTITPTYRNAVLADFDMVTALTCELYKPMLGFEYDDLVEENKVLFSDSKQGFILAFDGDTPIAVAHVALRSDYVNGVELGGTFGYLEAIYVKPEYRNNKIAATLVGLCEDWARERGCREFISDCLLDNTDSYLFHLAVGFVETERCIFFRKDISNDSRCER